MQEIEWKPEGSLTDVHAKIGMIRLYCDFYFVDFDTESSITPTSENGRWSAHVSILDLASTLRFGPNRRSLVKAKEDAVRIARELLLDYYTSVVGEMSRFDLVVDDE